jgi:biotin carboxyl carrier protein
MKPLKTENAIAAPSSGTVKSILFKGGNKVSRDDVRFVIG